MVSFAGSPEVPTQGARTSPSTYPDGVELKAERGLPNDGNNATSLGALEGPGSRSTVGVAILSYATRVVYAACINPVVWVVVAYLAWTCLSGTMHPLIGSATTIECNSSTDSNQIAHCSTPELVSPNFRKLVTFQSRFQRAMEESTSASIIAVDIKQSEMAVRDLTTLVDLSTMVSGDSLVKNLRQFVEDAKTTGKGLQIFGSHIRGAVDEIVTLNEHALDLLERTMKDTQPRLDDGLFQRAIKNWYPDKPVAREVIEARNKEIKEVWVKAIGAMKSAIERLSKEAVINAKALDRLNGHLSVIHKIASRAKKTTTQDKSKLHDQWWTSLGWNKEQLAEYESHLRLLNEVQNYRKDAANHVAVTILQLQQMELDLVNLNEMVATSTLSNKGAGISLKGHIETIQKGTDKMLRERARVRERESNYMLKAFGGNPR